MSQRRPGRGFKRAATLVQSRIRTASESRGFAVARLLTHWSEIVGADVAAMARPVNVSYGRGFGATLTLLTSGPEAPMVEMQKETIRERVNACYGYAAIQKIRVTQTAPTGFAEGQVEFSPAPKQSHPAPIAPEVTEKARSATNGVGDASLREALARLGANILSQSKQQ